MAQTLLTHGKQQIVNKILEIDTTGKPKKGKSNENLANRRIGSHRSQRVRRRLAGQRLLKVEIREGPETVKRFVLDECIYIYSI